MSGRPRASSACPFSTRIARVFSTEDCTGLRAAVWARLSGSAKNRHTATFIPLPSTRLSTLISASIVRSVPRLAQTEIYHLNSRWKTGRDSDRNRPNPCHTDRSRSRAFWSCARSVERMHAPDRETLCRYGNTAAENPTGPSCAPGTPWSLTRSGGASCAVRYTLIPGIALSTCARSVPPESIMPAHR